MSAVDLDALIAELRTPIRVQYEEKPNHVLRRANVSRLNAAKALEDLRRAPASATQNYAGPVSSAAPVSAGKVKALDPEQLVAAWMAESEGFATGGERFMDTIMDGNDVAPWLRAAVQVGIDAAMALQPGDGWQGIESAPLGQDVLLSSPSGVRIDDWALYCRHNGPGFTHWMPLPAPPASLPQGEETR